ncbi:MAG: NYN domain-containing protein [Candidatus Omnitrophica bacterium]|nr:NYN domain-containing protein [Candidatus Omnitrophota bacterium]MDD5352123.1 NYN domain-containing protein [Candidatus Omnitrophota bacterium]MDD5549721.1 NYN domain-containing protein [Candidatus Omnitrophota bacterium]
MPLHYIVDGYNVIKRTGFLNHKKLRDARNALLGFIDKYRPHGSYKNKITVVFDGRDDVFGFRNNHDFGVIFSKNESADNLIKSLVDKTSNPRNIIVVSDDKEIIFHCRSQGAEILTTDDFVRKAYKKTDTAKTNNTEFSELSFAERKKINDELSQIWLK